MRAHLIKQHNQEHTAIAEVELVIWFQWNSYWKSLGFPVDEKVKKKTGSKMKCPHSSS